MSKPIVAIVGRPNVGKSTLFNVIAGDSIAIVKDTPGVTRDRIYADCSWLNYNFTLIDTGGIEPDSSDVILSQMRDQAQIAIDTADVIIFLVDVRQGLTDADGKVADIFAAAKSQLFFVLIRWIPLRRWKQMYMSFITLESVIRSLYLHQTIRVSVIFLRLSVIILKGRQRVR